MRRPVDTLINDIHSAVLGAQSYRALGRESTEVLAAVLRELAELSEAALNLPNEFTELRTIARTIDVEALRELPDSSRADRIWATVESLTHPIAAAVIAGTQLADSRTEPPGWFITPDGTRDYSYADSHENTPRGADLLIPGLGSFGCLVLDLWVQLPASAAEALSGDAGMHRWARRLGLGRVRKDGSTPLQPSADRIWVQSVLGDATLIMRHERSDSGYAYLTVGRLDRGTRRVAASFGFVGVQLFVADDFLPEALWTRHRSLIAARSAWGGLVSVTARDMANKHIP